MMSLTSRTSALLFLLVAPLSACQSGADLSATSGAHATRTVEHALGQSEIPVDPQRIVVLDSAYVLDNVISLGFGDAVIGRVDLNGVGDVRPSWLDDAVDLDGIAFLGGVHPDGVDLEGLAEMEPDLVIGVGSAFGEQYDEISAIAPAVAPVPAPGYVVGAWSELTRATGEVLDRKAEAEELIAGVQDHLASRIAEVPEGALDRTLTTLGGWTGEPSLYFSASEDVTWMFDEAGFSLNPGFPDTDYELLSPELYGKAESEVIVIADFAAGTIDYDELLEDNAILSGLTAVQESQVVIVDGLLLTSSGPAGQPEAIDAVFDQIVAAQSS